MIVRLATNAMGTRFEFVLAGEDESHLRATGEEAIEEIQHWHKLLNYFSSDSEVTRINKHAVSNPVKTHEDVWSLLLRCQQLYHQTQGTFDITIAPLMHKFGFRDDTHAGNISSGFKNVILNQDDSTIHFEKPGMRIDLGGIAKGWALDCAGDLLREKNIDCALLHGGTSTIVGIGSPPGSDGWPIAVSLPENSQEDELEINIKNTSLSVSTPHGRMVEQNGEKLGHVIDPFSKTPAKDIALAAAMCKSATDADAWSTALIILKEQPPGLENQLSSWIIPTDSNVQNVEISKHD